MWEREGECVFQYQLPCCHFMASVDLHIPSLCVLPHVGKSTFLRQNALLLIMAQVYIYLPNRAMYTTFGGRYAYNIIMRP